MVRIGTDKMLAKMTEALAGIYYATEGIARTMFVASFWRACAWWTGEQRQEA